MKKGRPDKAQSALDKALRMYPDYYEALADRAALWMVSHPQNAEKDLLRLIELDPQRDLSVFLALGNIQQKDHRFDEAIAHYERLLSLIGKDHRHFATASREKEAAVFRRYAYAHPVEFHPEPAGGGVNAPGASQYGAVLTADNKTMIFTRRIGHQEDFYLSRKTQDEWGQALPLLSLNTDGNEGMHTISRDGRSLIFTRCDDRQGWGSCDLYESHQTGDQNWSKPVNLGKELNSKFWDAQPSLSADGRTLIFASNRDGGAGQSDLWWAKRDEQGQWGLPVPLPGKINTPGKEQSPFLHADGVTLYFASDGHPGLGDMDLFMSRYDADRGWLAPVNLGYPINTGDHDGALSLELDGRTAWLATNRFEGERKSGGLSIYRFSLPAALQGQAVTYVEGHIKNRKNGQHLDATLVIQGGDDASRELQQFRADKDGYFMFCLPSGQSYVLHIDHPGYAFYSDRFELGNSLAFRPYQLDVALSPVEEVGSEVSVVLKNILFESGSDRLMKASHAELNQIYRWMTDHADKKVRIEGHTDNTGTAEANLMLSQRRAERVRDWLMVKGIQPDRLSAIGYGSARPMADNQYPEGRQLNRRTEMVILP